MKLFLISSDQYCSHERDSNLGPSRISVVEDCKVTAQTTQPPTTGCQVISLFDAKWEYCRKGGGGGRGIGLAIVLFWVDKKRVKEFPIENGFKKSLLSKKLWQILLVVYIPEQTSDRFAGEY